ncbi:MAG: alpha/beta hydrolase [Deltaproteobacteria bacterium]|nr:alpha/beta hydrolase [Deltaproteobacteria bacterium]
MATFDSGGVEIAYCDEGRGRPVVLVHGFAASVDANWRAPGWIEALVGSGRRVVALDCRGHGASGKPTDPEAYGGDAMPGDVLRLMDHLGIERADLMGYSMGGMISTSLLAHHQDRLGAVVLAGIGGGAVSATAVDRSEVADALAESVPDAGGDSSRGAVARAFREFAESVGNDLQALAAVMRSRRATVGARDLANVEAPVLIVVGDKDDLVGDPAPLRDAVPGSELVIVPGDHLTAVAAPLYKQSVLAFLQRHSPV